MCDLFSRFPADRPLMLVAIAQGQAVGGALAFRGDSGWVTLRIIAVVEAFRHRGIGRRLVERVEAEARLLGAEGIALGTDEAVGFWYHLGYTPALLLQWIYDAELYEAESETLLAGPLAGLPHSPSSFNGVPQLFVTLDQPRLDLRNTVREIVTGCHVGFMMAKKTVLPDLTVRDASPLDGGAVAGLLTQLGYPTSQAEAAERLAKLAAHPGSWVLVADTAHGVVGLVSFQVISLLAEGGSFARITALAVDRGQRRKGLGSQLLLAAEDAAHRAGCTLVEVSSGRRPERAAAHAFYRAHGYYDTTDRSTRYWKRLDGQS